MTTNADITYDVQGYPTQADFDASRYDLIDAALCHKADALEIGRENLLTYAIVKVQSDDREFIAILTRKPERWAFTQGELTDPAELTSTDELIASVPREFSERGIIVYRNGTVSNRFSDGVAGVSQEAAELAAEDESPYNLDTHESAETWRDVWVDQDGRFLAFREGGK